MNQGIWTVVDRYFWSWFVWIDLQLLVQFGQVFFGFSKDMHVTAAVPFPAGKLIGGLMFVNLLAAHLIRFKLSWKRAGIVTLHSGILLLFIGEYITREYQVEQQMHITEGTSSNFAFDTRNYELAFIDLSDPNEDRVTVVPAKLLQQAKPGERISSPELPVDIEVLQYMANADLVDLQKSPLPAGENPATAGLGLAAGVKEVPEVTGVGSSRKGDTPAAYVRFLDKQTGQPIGTYLVSLGLKDQTAELAGKPYTLALRFTHYYKPFSLHLEKFRFDRYVGTNTAKNYSSKLILTDPERGQEREVVISMNEPLRYRGEAFYQADFDKETEKTTVLQVVRNPGWLLPYLACILVTVGMLVHFGIGLTTFLRSHGERAITALGVRGYLASYMRQFLTMKPVVSVPKLKGFARFVPWLCTAAAVLYLVGAAFRGDAGPGLSAVASLPVVEGGRVKPLDTVARVALRQVSDREEVYIDGKPAPAIKWYMDLASAHADQPGPAAKYEVLRIHNDQVRSLLGLDRRDGYRYSLEEVLKKFPELRQAAVKARSRPEKERDLFEAKVLELWKHIGVIHEFWQGEAPLNLPPADGREWRTAGGNDQAAQVEAVRAVMAVLGKPVTREDLEKLPEAERKKVESVFREAYAAATARDKAATAWQKVLKTYREGGGRDFETAIADFQDVTRLGVSGSDLTRVKFETFLNRFAPFYHCIFMYGMALFLCVLGWMFIAFGSDFGEAFRRASYYTLAATFVLHTFSLFARMYLMDRPLVFVTNLYSTAVFIGWAAAGACLIIERVYPISLGNLVAGVLGVLTCIIAHQLAAAGDTLEMMQAVLDTNFWLATHVTTINLGYAATFIAGLIGVTYIVLGVLTPILKEELPVGARPQPLGRLIGQVLYAAVCAGTLLSFVGTVLGGIWADQSWGRFWGWDPKENGAVLIVLWNALILHARWCGLVKDRGMAILSLVGNMITAWSWFGTNQLGVGLHAYGFNNTLALGCVVTWVFHTLLIGVGVGWVLADRFAQRQAAAA
jgi:ABC-type transport system involved in cytochrome c biogenesis permease subunit